MVHNRYTSSTYDLVLDTLNTINTMTSEFNNLVKLNDNGHQLKINEWYEIIPSALYYKGHDELIFKDFYIMIYEDINSKLLNSVFISKFGELHYNAILIDKKSKYYPAVENLSKEFQKSNVRKILAVTCLRAFSQLSSFIKNKLNPHLVEVDLWDETTAGELANKMTLIDTKKPSDLGLKFMDLGFLQTQYINSAIVDIVYSNKTQQDIDDNNKLVFSIGEQLDQLFDPLTEYSPEATEKVYQPPNINENSDSSLSQSICQELLQFQKNATTNLVDFLQNYILPLRIRVLNGGIKGYTTSKLNTVFPPTIDEVTRINCIYLDALKLAIPYGSFEVIKASGMTIPYFYKAYMRHEAATKNFNTNLKAFLRDLHKQGIDEDFVYTKQKIESIIHGSLNLTKIKLILNRLVKCDNTWTQFQESQVSEYIESSTITIDSFAKDTLAPYHQRVFTPTGKILTELANGWPTELQYGWLTRRVVAIYDVENLLDNRNEVLIIFSDHVLFLIVNEHHDNNDFHRPSISDILMHSLINESPIKNIPSLTVNGWADIQGIYASTYLDDQILKLIINDSNGIITPQSPDAQYTRFYKLSAEKKGDKVIELINKAKILNKTQPFHLFKTRKYGLTLYSTARDFVNYREETIKSPFAIFLKTSVDNNYLRANKIFFALSVFIENEYLVLKGIYQQHYYDFEKKIKPEDLYGVLCELMSVVCSRYLNYDVNTTEYQNLLNSSTETIEILDCYIHDKKPRSAPPPPLPASVPQQKQRLLNRRSLEMLTGPRQSSGSSVIHRKKTTETHRSEDSKRTVGSKKSFTGVLKRRGSNDENRRSNSLVKKLGKVFKSKENLKKQDKENVTNKKDETFNGHNKKSEPATEQSSIYINKAFEFPGSPEKPQPAKKIVKPRVATNKPDPIIPVPEKPLAYAQLHTSHSVRKKLSKLMDDMKYDYYDDGQSNWEVFGHESSLNFTSDENSVKPYTVSPNASPSKTHNYRALVQFSRDKSPITEEFHTPKIEQLKEEPKNEIFETPVERFAQSDIDDDTFSITFDDVEDDFALNVIDINGYDSMTTVKKSPSEANDSVIDATKESQDVDEFYSPAEEKKLDFETQSESQDDSITELMRENFEKCEPQPQQFTYKSTEEYDKSHESTIINQIQLDLTASDFTMSSDSQQDDEEELKANLTWYSPSQLDVLNNYDKPKFTTQRKNQFTSKINIVQPPVKEEAPSKKQYYLPKEDSVRFDEPVLRSSSYSYLMGILNDEDVGFDMDVIPEDNIIETTMMYDNKLTDNLKESSIKYLAGYIRDDNDDRSILKDL